MRLEQFAKPGRIFDAPLRPICWTVLIEGDGAIGFKPFIDNKVEVKFPLLNAAIDNVQALTIEGKRISFFVDICVFSTDQHSAANEIRSSAVVVDVTGNNSTLNLVEPSVIPKQVMVLKAIEN